MKKMRKLTLSPLSVDEALADLLRIPPERSSQKPKAARKGPKKKPSRKR